MSVIQERGVGVLGVIMMLLLTACEGIFDHIYDAPLAEEMKEYGFILVDDKCHTGRIYIDATDYTQWHYIDLIRKEVITKGVEEKAPSHWSFAVHRYDAKTHAGAVLESAATDFDSLPSIQDISGEHFVTDEWTTNKITVDMSQMMNGVIRYAEDDYNPCLSKWLRVDTSSMPPLYSLSGKIYLLRLSDGSYAALRLSNFINDAAVKGFMTIDYLYPVDR